MDDEEKLAAATIELGVLKATEKLRPEFRRRSVTYCTSRPSNDGTIFAFIAAARATALGWRAVVAVFEMKGLVAV